ncbi:MAG TPA: tetratricopeptide repeat protein [Rhizomicrobium sp.]|nr:tetratricopeptide repeat protein [Rhizomicrobium sp.]
MTDIFREVEEDVRREKLEKLWKAYGNYVIAAVVLLFAGIAGWQVWERHDAQERAKVSDAFIAAQRITNPQTAASTFADIARTAPKGYAELARLSEAGAMFASGQTGPAVDLYKQIAKDDNGPVGAVARLRAAWATADTASRKDLADLVKPLDQPGSPWRQSAQEVLAYADYRAMDTKDALAKYAILAADPESPDSLKRRAQAMTDFLKGGGAISYGTVPVTPSPAANAAAPAGSAPAAPGATAPAKTPAAPKPAK